MSTKPKEYSSMTKDKLMTYTFVALLAITIISSILLAQEVTPSGWNLGLTVGICTIIAVGVAVGLDALLYKLVSDSPLNIMSAAVFGLIVVNSYTLGIPLMRSVEVLPLEAPDAFIYVALISMIGLIVFKKVAGIAGRKYVNPAAVAKLLVMIPFLNSVFIVSDHLKSGMLSVPSLAGPIGYSVINGNGSPLFPTSFASYVVSCFANPAASPLTAVTQNDVLNTLFLQKFHGWVGGASALAVIIVGIAFFVVARRYVKWRITVAYLITAAVMALILTAAYGGDAMLRVEFELLIGSSIFLAFFMATDPATTPLTYTGQIIFGVGLGVLTVLIQTYLNFFGGSILALVVMNLTAPALDKIGKLKPTTESKEPKLPKAKAFAPEKVKETQCIRCGACMRVCCHKLSPIMIKQAFDKQNFEAVAKLNADYCTGCGHCTFVCPARIDLRKSILQAKGALRG
jgi:Na+-translocating ferredoxin:NAD+ oxidoreductase subunit D